MQATRLLEATRDAIASGARYVVHEGGTRASKTHTICQILILLCLQHELEIDVVRASMPTLRRSAMKDFKELLERYDLYSEDRHNKTESIFHVGRSTVAFFGADEAQKLRGPERDIAWINEANEISEEEWKEIRRRTRQFIIIDYNPSHGATHWIDQQVIGSGREVRIHSTYLDNRFLTDAQIRDIEADVPRYREPDGTVVTDWELEYDGEGVLISGDPGAWAVNGLGKRAKAEAIIYKHWTWTDRMPDGLDMECYGLDFGYSNPSALVRVGWKDVVGEAMNLIWDEVLYQKGLTNSQLADAMDERGVSKTLPIWADSAEPDRIEELCDRGYNARPALKDVTAGIIVVKEHRLRITRRSVNLQYEIERYKRREDKDGNLLEEPYEKDDHGMDGGRYGTFSQLRRKHSQGGAVSTMRGEGEGGAPTQKGLHSKTTHPLVSMR